jgi:hypothetical protein
MIPVYHTLANTMQRLGVQPARPKAVERRQSHGRRFQDSGWQFLLDHAVLSLLEVCIALLIFLFCGGTL